MWFNIMLIDPTDRTIVCYNLLPRASSFIFYDSLKVL